MSDEGVEPKAGTKKAKAGWEDRGGLGFFGLTGGLVGGFILSFYVVAPPMLADKSLGSQTVATVVSLVLMIVLAGVGYYFTKRPAPRAKGKAA